jgi:hypothetical protein
MRATPHGWEVIAFHGRRPVSWLNMRTGEISMNAPDIRYRDEHRQLRRRLQHYRWSVAELAWLAQHARAFPLSLEKLIHVKLAEAEKDASASGQDARSLVGGGDTQPLTGCVQPDGSQRPTTGIQEEDHR